MSDHSEEVKAEAWDWLAEHINLELSWGAHPDAAEGDPCVWLVYRVSGSVNDREWEFISSGETPLDAVLAGRASIKPKGES